MICEPTYSLGAVVSPANGVAVFCQRKWHGYDTMSGRIQQRKRDQKQEDRPSWHQRISSLLPIQ